MQSSTLSSLVYPARYSWDCGCVGETQPPVPRNPEMRVTRSPWSSSVAPKGRDHAGWACLSAAHGRGAQQWPGSASRWLYDPEGALGTTGSAPSLSPKAAIRRGPPWTTTIGSQRGSHAERFDLPTETGWSL